jgi:hypothetical protein
MYILLSGGKARHTDSKLEGLGRILPKNTNRILSIGGNKR